MKAFVLTIIGLILITGSFIIFNHELHRWEKEPDQVISCAFTLILISGVVMFASEWLWEEHKQKQREKRI